MAVPTIILSDVLKKHLTIVVYLLISGGLGYVLALIAGRPELTAIFAPAINYILYAVKRELDGQGVVKAIEERK